MARSTASRRERGTLSPVEDAVCHLPHSSPSKSNSATAFFKSGHSPSKPASTSRQVPLALFYDAQLDLGAMDPAG